MAGIVFNPDELQNALINDPALLNQNQADLEQARKAQNSQNIMTEVLMGLHRVLGGRGQPQLQGLAAQGLLTGQARNFAQFNREPLQPLPFNQYYSNTANFLGIVQSMTPEAFQGDQQVKAQLEQMAPEAIQALQTDNFSLYEGVSDNFFINRFNISLRRAREDNVYAFK